MRWNTFVPPVVIIHENPITDQQRRPVDHGGDQGSPTWDWSEILKEMKVTRWTQCFETPEDDGLAPGH